MGILKNIFNSDQKYYLEIDEANGSSSPEVAVAENPVKVAEPQPVTETTTTAEQVAAQAKGNKKGEKSATKTQAKTETNSKTQPVGPAYEPPFWVAAMYNNNSSSNNGNGNDGLSEATFATDNLMPTITNSRRSPGPSLNKFRDMASRVRSRGI